MIDDQTHVDTDGSEADDKSKEMIEDEIQKRVSRNYTISKITIIKMLSNMHWNNFSFISVSIFFNCTFEQHTNRLFLWILNFRFLEI